MSKTFFRENSQKIEKNRCQFFLDFFCFIAFSGVPNRQKNPKPIFSWFCFITLFGRFSVRGVQKHDKKSRKKV
jgi:hypothetical protein